MGRTLAIVQLLSDSSSDILFVVPNVYVNASKIIHVYIFSNCLLFSIKENTMEHTYYRKIYDNYDGATVLC